MIQNDDQVLDILNPSPVESLREDEQIPEPEILPTSESVLNAGEPEPLYPAEINPITEFKPFDWKQLTVPKLNNYVPRGSIPETDPEGSVFMAYLENENTILSLANRRSSRDFTKVDPDNFNVAEHLTPEQIPDLEYYVFDTTQEEIDDTSAQLAKERQNKAIMAAHPWQTFGIGLATAPFEITNYLPGGVIYNRAKSVASAARVFAATSSSALVSSAASEVILHNSQLTRTVEESAWNVAVSSILGGALGVGANSLGKSFQLDPKLEKKAYDNIMDIMIDPDASPRGSAGAAKVETLDDRLADIPELVKKSMILSPGVRLASSDFKVAREFNSIFTESTLYTEANKLGQTRGHALETYIKQRNRMPLEYVTEYNNAYLASLGIENGPAIVKRARGVVAKKEMNAAQFARRVSRSLFTDVDDPNPFVKRGADAIRKGFEANQKPLVEMGYLKEGKGTATSEGYLPIVYNQQKIIEQGGRNAWGPGTFPQAVFDGMKKTQTEIKLFKDTPTYKSKQKNILDLKHSLKGKNKSQKAKIQKSIDEIEADLKKLYNPKWLDSDGNLREIIEDDLVLRDIALQTVDTILSQDGDKLLNRLYPSFGNPKSLKSRTLMIDQEELSPWHLANPVKLLMMQTRALAPFIEKQALARRLGFTDFDDMWTNFSNKLKAEYDLKSEGKTGKEAAKLEKQFRQTQNDMTGIKEILDGVFGQGENTITSTGFQKFFKAFRDYNYLSMMGNITIQSFNDIGSIMIRNGVFKTMYHGLLPMITDMKKITKRDLKALSYGFESELGMMTQRFMDQESLSTNPGIFAKSIDAIQSVYGDLTLFNQWTGMVQRLSMTTSINHTLETIHNIVQGLPVKAKDRTRLAQLGLRDEYFKYIYDQTSGSNNISSNGTRVADWTTWEPKNTHEANALRDFQAATAKDIDQTIIQPGAGDKPLVSHSALGKTLFQFKGFGFASTNKILYSAIQRRRDAEVYTGLTAMITLGTLSYAATQYTRGQEPNTDFKTLALESIDRSGVMGVLMEAFNISQTLGVFGPSEGVTRYKSRGLQGAVLGPTGGRIVDIGLAASTLLSTAWGEHDYTTKDLEKTLRLMPLYNIAYVRGLNDLFITGIGDTFNLQETREGK